MRRRARRANAPARALVMAGGRGSRMQATRPGVPKPLVPVDGVPLLGRVLSSLADAGVRSVTVSTGHAAVPIESFAREAAGPLGLDLDCLREDRPLGTVGALGLLPDAAGPTLVVNGDLLSALDLSALLEAHARRGADLTVATHVEQRRLHLGEVVVEPDGRISAYREKPIKRYTISSGTYVLSPAAVALVRRDEVLGADGLVERSLAAGLVVCAHADAAPWLDVNDASDLAEAEALLRRNRAAFASREPAR